MLRSNVYVAIPLFLLLGVLQTAVLHRFPLFGVIVQLFLIVVFVWAMIGEMQSAVIWAFVAGIILDLFSFSPFGARSLGLIAAAVVINILRAAVPRNRYIGPLLLGFVGTTVFLVIYLAILVLVGQGTGAANLNVWLPYVAMHSILTLPLYLIINLVRRLQDPYQLDEFQRSTTNF